MPATRLDETTPQAGAFHSAILKDTRSFRSRVLKPADNDDPNVRIATPRVDVASGPLNRG